ncbi:class I SAM-dependent methyltransferase [Lacinutrix sp. 5H-3-7-4]|uniref:class I SAM-dependent methyltransferase n=1 Tax=Lacinutrix sp. (strain 5H-3-7-4) TaxID=983544 RepID=UPI00020A37E5|nr:class I SAM-dependent methyltransferase [Lacinutrix sp. 5H-3-7-4]AEH00859.1 Methyltransferase type 12 [Lacinutrix sp. 5H-3-7-4]
MQNSKKINFKVKDYSVSGETFTLIHNNEFDYLETLPKPSLNKLPEYYKSEDYISHTNAKRNLFEKVYHQVRVYSLKKKVKLINSFNTESKNILDFGCGTGAFLNEAQNQGWNITGIEPDEKARILANTQTNNAVLPSQDFNTLPEKSFDVITLWHVLEHIPDLQEKISQLKKLLKENGTLIIAVPNYNSFDAKHYKSFWAAFDVPRHLWHFSKKSITTLFAREKMKVVKIKPMLFDAFYVSLLSEKYKTSKMNPIKSFYTGLLSNFKAIRSGEYSSLIYVIKNM